MKKKVNATLFVLALFFGLPLSAKPQLLLHPCILLIMAATALVWLTQPGISKKDASKNQLSDQNSVWLILGFSALSVIAPVVEWAYFGVRSSATNFGFWQMAGLVFVVTGIALRLWAIRTLGVFFTSTVQVQAQQRVVRSGPYAWVRHPSYLGAYLAFVGCSILLESWAGLIIAAFCMGFAYYVRIRAEESALVFAFGDEYRSYQQHSWRMLPGLW